MIERTICRPDKELLTKLQRIFGNDLVTHAYVTTYAYGHTTEKEIEDRLSAERFPADDGSDTLNYDSQDIVVRFSNGRIIKFNNSEWGYIRKLNVKLEFTL